MSARTIATALAVAAALVPAACAPSTGSPASDANGQCAVRKNKIRPVSYETAATTRYTFTATVLTDECESIEIRSDIMIVNVWMRQTDPSGRDNPVGVSHVEKEERSPFAFPWTMDRGYAHELLGNARVDLTAKQIDDYDAGFLECEWMMNGKPFPANYGNLIHAREIKPIRAGQETMVECHGNLPPD